MNYNVENTVLFDSDLNTLTHAETQECISLTMSQSMLLELILSSKSEILSRDSIIDMLWHRHGINSSVHTLNQYISLLRRLFSHFGLDDVIITIPRVGIRLNPDTEVLQCSDVVETPPQIEDIETLAPVKEHDVFFSHRHFIIFLLSAIIIGLLLARLVYQLENKRQGFYYINDNGCEIGLVVHFTKEDQNNIIKQIREIFIENNLTCSRSRVVFFDVNKSLSGPDYGRALLAFCTKNDTGKIISCENYYYKNWRAE